MAISPPRISLSVRPIDPSAPWLALQTCIIATMIVATFGAVIVLFELFAAPAMNETDLAWTIWSYGYAYLSYAIWAVFILSLTALMWLTYRLARNLHALATDRFAMSPTYAISFYLVPFANLVMPPRVTALIARDTFAAAGEARRHNAVIGWWWGTFLTSALFSNVAAVIAQNAGVYSSDMAFDSAAYESSLWLSLAAWIINVIACWFMLQVFGPIASAQSKLIREGAAS
jgi:hypothetical protein